MIFRSLLISGSQVRVLLHPPIFQRVISYDRGVFQVVETLSSKFFVNRSGFGPRRVRAAAHAVIAPRIGSGRGIAPLPRDGSCGLLSDRTNFRTAAPKAGALPG